MAISTGFFKYVYKWITDEETENPIYRPFETSDNPYKAKLFIVGSHPTPTLSISKENVQEYANALVNREELLNLIPDYFSKTSRDVKGAIRFSQYLKNEYDIISAVSYANALTVTNLTELKKMKKEKPLLYNRGLEIFKEVIEEIKPDAILLHGSYALEEFRKNLEHYYIEFGPQTRSVADLDGSGVIGKIIHDDGRETKVFATRSLSFFKENDEKYEQLIKEIQEA